MLDLQQKIFGTFFWIVLLLSEQLKNGLADFEIVILNWVINLALDGLQTLITTLREVSWKISNEEIAESLNIDNLTAFYHLKKLGYTFKLDTFFDGKI